MLGERRSRSEDVRSQRKEEPLESKRFHDGKPATRRRWEGNPASRSPSCAAGETGPSETEAGRQGEARADVPILRAVRSDLSARYFGSGLGPGARERRRTGGRRTDGRD